MLISKLNEINDVLDKLISITKEDIESIKEAHHEKIFANISQKENLAKKFEQLKNEIDSILLSRNLPIEEIFSKDEELEFEKFKEKLNNFYKYHKHFSRLSMAVNNFYTTLLNKLKQKEQITYNNETIPNSHLQLKA